MSFGAFLLLALGLAMDATAVAAARGAQSLPIRARDVALVAGTFGGFHALMPFLGWLAGAGMGTFIERWDHWAAFALLAGIGGKMLWESRRAGPKLQRDEDPFGATVILVLALATSVDAAAVGITLPLLGVPMLPSVATIGVVTALASGAGLFAGHRFGALIGQRFEAIGGLVLVGMGLKILLQHLLSGR